MHHQKSKIVDNLCDTLLTFRKLVENFGDLSLQLCDIPASRKEEADSPRVVRKTAELEQQLGDCYSRFQAIGEPMKPVHARGYRQGRSLVKCRHKLSARSHPSALRVIRPSPLQVWRWRLTRVARQPPPQTKLQAAGRRILYLPPQWKGQGFIPRRGEVPKVGLLPLHRRRGEPLVGGGNITPTDEL